MPRKTSTRQSKSTPDSQLPPNLDATHVVALIPIQPYQVIGNVGCGSGQFAVALAKQVFDGRVYALDSRQSMVDSAEQEIERVHLSNVEARKMRGAKLPLEDDSLDGVFVAPEMHRAKDLKALLRDSLRCLHKSGWLALLGWQENRTNGGPPEDERVGESELRDLGLDIGFRFTSRHFPSPELYMLLMRK
jgi:ubiquinone/menaquinone biosynthesis C-methylase UbiE